MKGDKAVLVVGCTVAFVALTVSFTVVAVTTDDPDVFYRFLGGQFLGNLGTFIVLIITAVLSRKVNQVGSRVEAVEKNTNGTTTALFDQNNRMTQYLIDTGADPVEITRTDQP